jgi:hypothetical protein
VVCKMDPGATGVLVSSLSWQGSDRRPQTLTILEKGKKVVWPHPSGRDRVKGDIHRNPQEGFTL